MCYLYVNFCRNVQIEPATIEEEEVLDIEESDCDTEAPDKEEQKEDEAPKPGGWTFNFGNFAAFKRGSFFGENEKDASGGDNPQEEAHTSSAPTYNSTANVDHLVPTKTTNKFTIAVALVLGLAGSIGFYTWYKGKKAKLTATNPSMLT